MNTKTKDKISALLLVIRRVAYAEGNMAARAASAEDSEMRCYFSDLAEECSHFGDMLAVKVERLGKEDMFHD